MASCFPYKDPDCCRCSYNNHVYDKRGKFECPIKGPDIYYCLKDAVVRIRTVTGLLFDNAQVNRITEGNGFLVKYGDGCHHCLYVVTASQLLLVEPGNGTRIPPPVDLPGAQNFARVDEIYVEVTNVNGCGVGYIYKAVLVGLDGANDVGVLRIDPNEEYNRSNPVLNPKKHPSLEWGCSRRTPIGTAAYLISGEGQQQLQESVISNNRYFQFAGQPSFEGVLVRGFTIDPDDTGAPFLDARGRVIGVAANIPFYNFQGAVAQHIAQRIVEAIIGGLGGCYGAQLEVFQDPLGPFLRYRKGFFGFLWEAFNAFATLQVAAPPPPPPPPIPNLRWQKLQGLIIIDILQGEEGIVSPFLPFFLNLPENTNILITNINGCPAGIQAPQITFNAISVHSLPGESAILTYRLSTDGYAQAYRVQAPLAPWPLFFDNVFTIAVSLAQGSAHLKRSLRTTSLLHTFTKVPLSDLPLLPEAAQPVTDGETEKIEKNPETENVTNPETSELDILGAIRSIPN